MAKTYSITVNGDRWKYRKVPKHSEDWVARTHRDKKLIEFSEDHVRFGPVFHELMHAYCHYLYLNSSEIEHDQYEEIICEMLEEKVLIMIEQARKMLTKLQGDKDVRNEIRPGKARPKPSQLGTDETPSPGPHVRNDKVLPG